MSCDYTDIIMPIDYTPEAFEFVNRKQYDKWKMIGMQVSHMTEGDFGEQGVARVFTRGMASGCKPIEEINQNNHIIGRGSYYFRAKSDASGIPSATYGIMGHCNTPGLEKTGAGVAPFYTDRAEYLPNPTDGDLENEMYSPMGRSWGRSMGQNLCFCARSKYWTLGAFVKNNKTGNVFFRYSVDNNCDNAEDKRVCAALNTRLPGRFNAWNEDYMNPYRTCEATMRCSIMNEGNGAGTCNISQSTLDSLAGSISNIFTETGVDIKLTSLPACNHFDKTYERPEGIFNYNGTLYSNVNYKCERAVLRIRGFCSVGVAFGPRGNFNTLIIDPLTGLPTKKRTFHTYEYHYDRWDPSEEGGALTPDIAYKIFDEVFEIPELDLTVRILAHHLRVLNDYDYLFRSGGDPREHMTPIYVTGGISTQRMTDSNIEKGCRCSHQGQNENHYPIRPYNEFVYCPNNFTCEKSC